LEEGGLQDGNEFVDQIDQEEEALKINKNTYDLISSLDYDHIITSSCQNEFTRADIENILIGSAGS
jgi:hypothetical protein